MAASTDTTSIPSAPDFDDRQQQTRTVEALLRCANSLRDADDEQAVLARYCQALTAQLPHLVLGWTWFGHADSALIWPQVFAGPASSYAESLAVPRDSASVRGPAFEARLTGKLSHRRLRDFSADGP